MGGRAAFCLNPLRRLPVAGGAWVMAVAGGAGWWAVDCGGGAGGVPWVVSGAEAAWAMEAWAMGAWAMGASALEAASSQ